MLPYPLTRHIIYYITLILFMLLQIETTLHCSYVSVYLSTKPLVPQQKHPNDKSSQITCIDWLQKTSNILIAGEQRKPNQNISLLSNAYQLLFDGMGFIHKYQHKVSFIRQSNNSIRMRVTKKVKTKNKNPPQKQKPNKTQTS